MRRVFLIALLLALSASQADARHHGFHRYRYWGHLPRGMVAAVPYAIGRSLQRSVQGNQFPPPTWQLQPPDPNWQGRRFVSPDGTAWLAFYASPADGEPPSAHLKAVAFVDGEEITALHANSNQVIVSGVKGNRAFYRKARIACGGRAWHHVALEFPFTTDRQQCWLHRRRGRSTQPTNRDARGKRLKAPRPNTAEIALLISALGPNGRANGRPGRKEQ